MRKSTSRPIVLLTAAAAVLLLVLTSSSLQSSNAYSVQTKTRTTSCRNTPTASTSSRLFLSSEQPSSTAPAPRRKPLSPQEILKQQREKQGLGPDGDDAPKLFEDDVLDVMQQILLLLEKRAKDGPGCLSPSEVEDFAKWTRIVEEEMKSFEYHNRLKDASAAAGAQTTPQSASSTSTSSAPVAQAPPAAAVEQQVPSSMSSSSTDLSEDAEEYGPAYDGSGGMGLARGTRNTYVIDGMDEMSPAEYQKALQENIIRQQEERKSSGRNYGNRATWNYLSNLNASGGPLRSDIDGGDEDAERP